MTHADALDELEDQFIKHLRTRIMRQLEAGVNPPTFSNGIPILNYEVGGSFFAGQFNDKMLQRFRNILRRKEFRRLQEAGFRFNASNIRNMGVDQIMD